MAQAPSASAADHQVATDPAPPNQPLAPPVGAPTPYIRRKIDLIFTLGTGAFGEEGANTVTLTGHRCSATISHGAPGAKTMLSLRVWGMRFSQMQKLSSLGLQWNAIRENTVSVMAGDDLAGMTRIFQGTILSAYFDGESQPEVAFQVEAVAGAYDEMKPVPPVSVAGGVDVAGVMKILADKMKLSFENHGVVAKLRDVYFPGTAMQQVRRLAEHSGINWTADNGVLAIWPRGTGRGADQVPLISLNSGMKNYPTYDSRGIMVTCLFRPLKQGQQLVVQSNLWNNGKKTCYIIGYTYSLESEASNGQWFSTFAASWEPIDKPMS